VTEKLDRSGINLGEREQRQTVVCHVYESIESGKAARTQRDKLNALDEVGLLLWERKTSSVAPNVLTLSRRLGDRERMLFS